MRKIGRGYPLRERPKSFCIIADDGCVYGGLRGPPIYTSKRWQIVGIRHRSDAGDPQLFIGRADNPNSIRKRLPAAITSWSIPVHVRYGLGTGENG